MLNIVNKKKRILFKGTGWIDQLHRIIEFTGTPKESEIYGSYSGEKYMKKMSVNIYSLVLIIRTILKTMMNVMSGRL